MHVWLQAIPLALACAGLASLPARAAAPPVYQLTTVAGSDLVGDGGQAVAAQLAQPEGMALDSAGNLYIADAANHRVRKVTPAGVISTVAGNGHPGFSGDNGPASSAQLNQPYDLAMDAAGNLYIADYGNQRVRAIGTNGNITTVAGGGSSGASGDGGPAVSATLLGPRNVAVDASGNLYISEFNGHRVRIVAPGGTIETFAGTGIAGLSGDGGLATGAQLASPAGLAFDGGGNLYIVDTGNVRIRKVLAGAGTISTVLTEQTFGVPNVQLAGLAANVAGDLFIPDSVNAFVWQWAPGGAITRVAGTPASGASTGDGQPALQTALSSPVEVMMDAAGDLYISETRRVRVVAAATGIINTVAGNGTFGYSGDNGSALMAVLNAPTGLTLNNGTLYVSDSANDRVRAVAGGSITTVAGNGVAAYAGDGLAAVNANLDGPAGLAFDSSGNLYIADARNYRVRMVNAAGIIATYAGDGTASGFGGQGDPATLTPLNQPQGVAADSAGDVYIADTGHSRLIEVDPAGNIQVVAGTGTGGAAPGQLYNPSGLALDADGNLFIADTANHRIEMLSPAGVLSTVAGTGTAGFSGDGGAAMAAQLDSPAAVAVDANENIFIADTGNNRVRLITPDGNIATVAGTGDAAYNGDSGAALSIALFNPGGLALDGQGNVWIADTGNNRVRLMSARQTAVAPPVVISGLANSASLLPGPLAPGEIFSIFGQGLGPATALGGSYDANGMLSTTLGGVQVLFNGTAAPLFYVQSNQINAQVPYEVAGLDSAQMQIVSQGATTATMQVALTDASPALFTLNYGAGNAVIVNEDGTINSDQNPAAPGSIVVMYATGQGQTSPAGVTGQGAQSPYPQPSLPVLLTIAGITANLPFAGDAPGYVGLMQINAQVPTGFVPPGDLPVVLWIGMEQSPANVTIAVQ
ncbi:MAG: hypothetical protein ACLP59_06625 [Bryobacteraceae bacterium]